MMARSTRFFRAWRQHGWKLLVGLWVVALGLSITGWLLNAASVGRPVTVFDLAYRTLQLIPMNSGDPLVGAVAWPLDAARFLIPFLTAWTAVLALLGLFRERWRHFLLRFWKNHVIICGLSRKGWLLAQGFLECHRRVIVVEADEDHDLIDPCHERGITVLIGDATDPDLLRRAGVMRAQHLVAVTADDGINAEIAIRTQAVLREAVKRSRGRRIRSGALTCTIHLVDPQLEELARTRVLAFEVGLPLRLELLNVFQRGAQLLWRQYGPQPTPSEATTAQDAATHPNCTAHVLVVGLGWLGECLVAHAAREWHSRLHDTPCTATGRLRITVVDEQAGWKCEALKLRYPHLAHACDLVPLQANVLGPEFHKADFLAANCRRRETVRPNDCRGESTEPNLEALPVSAAFVCFDDDSLGLRTGLALHQHLLNAEAEPMPIVVRMAEAGGLARLVHPDHGDREQAAFPHLHAFGLMEAACTPAVIDEGTHETLARILHQAYVRRQQGLGQTVATNASLADWPMLPETLRESNRAQADATLHHLWGLGFGLIPLADLDARDPKFRDDEIERLAQKEHERFVNERISQGWRYTTGPKDVRAKLSPTLVQWDRLPEAEQAKTRDIMRALPSNLAAAGFQIVRIGAAQPPGSPKPQE